MTNRGETLVALDAISSSDDNLSELNSKQGNGAVIDTGQRACCEQRVLRGMELSLIQVGGPVQQIIEHVNK